MYWLTFSSLDLKFTIGNFQAHFVYHLSDVLYALDSNLITCVSYYFPIALPDTSVHAVCAAQSFHWFANDRSLSEIHRVLVPGGKLGLVWNTRDLNSVQWVKEMHEEIVFPIYAQTNTPNQRTFEWKRVLEASDKFGPIECDETFKFEQTFSTCEEVINRTMSSSVIQAKSEVEKEMIKNKLKLLLQKHEVDQQNEIVFPYVVSMYWCERK